MILLNILEFHRGCHGEPACFGPQDDWYTLLGVRLESYPAVIVFSLVATAVLYSILYAIDRKTGVKISEKARTAASIIFFMVVFAFMLWLRYGFESSVVY